MSAIIHRIHYNGIAISHFNYYMVITTLTQSSNIDQTLVGHSLKVAALLLTINGFSIENVQ